MYYSRRHACGTCIISLHTPFIFILLFSTVIYSVEVYGPETEAENIVLVSIRITGEDDARTANKRLTDRTTEVRGYEMYLSKSFAVIGYRTGKMALSYLTREYLPAVSQK